MKHFGINQVGIPKFQHPWRTLQVSRKQSETLNDLMSSIKVIYNNIIRKTKNTLSPHRDPGEVIDLSDKKLSRIRPETKDATAIYGNEFVENNANNIRTRKDFENTVDTLIGDHKIPLRNISTFYGIEEGKLKAGNINTFKTSTVVVPNRAKNIGRVKEIIFPQKLSDEEKDSLKSIRAEERLLRNQKLKNLAAEYNIDYGNNALTHLIYGSVIDNLYKYKRNANDSTFNEKLKQAIKLSRRFINAGEILKNNGPIQYVTETNDTILSGNVKIPSEGKVLFADEQGNSFFVNDIKDLSGEMKLYINDKLHNTPLYPILIDNGRYSHYQKKSPNYEEYVKNDFKRDPNSLYIIGAIK